MTLQEICKILGKSETTLISAFRRTQKNLKKKGIILTKEGEGRNANYTIIYEGDNQNEKNLDNLLS